MKAMKVVNEEQKALQTAVPSTWWWSRPPMCRRRLRMR
jgi:hypothetical protein